MGSGEGLDKIDGLITAVLKKSKRPLSTYEITKQVKISWGTVTSHCYKLKTLGIITSETTPYKTTLKRIQWWLVGGKS